MKKRFLPVLWMVATLGFCAEPVPSQEPVYAVVEVSSFARLQADAQALANALGSPGLATSVIGLGPMLGSPGMLGIDREKPLRLLFEGTEELLSTQPIVVVPLSEPHGESYLQSLEAFAEKKDSANGNTTFAFKRRELPYRFRVAAGCALFSAVEEGAKTDATLERIAAALEANPKAFCVDELSSGTLRIRLSTAIFFPRLEKMLREHLESLEDPTLRAEAREATTQFSAFFRAFTRLSIGISCTDEQGLSIVSRLDADPSSPIVGLFTPERAFDPTSIALIGGDAQFLVADAIQGILARDYAPLAKAYSTLLKTFPGYRPSKAQDALFQSWIDEAPVLPDFYAGALRYDAENRPYFVFEGRGGDPAAYCKAHTAFIQAQQDSNQVFTREVQGQTVQVAVIPVTDPPFLADYATENKLCYEMLPCGNSLLATAGPRGSIDAHLAGHPDLGPSASLALFSDLLGKHPVYFLFTADVASLIHTFSLWYNTIQEDPEKQVAPSTLERLAPHSGRFGTLLWTDPDAPHSLYSILRFSPSFFSALPALLQAVQDNSFPGLLRNDPIEPEPHDLTDDELEALLREADQIQD